MGTIFSPTYATLSTDYFELTFYRICINEFGEKLGQFILENLCRFIPTFNPNNRPVYNTIEDSVEVLKRNNVPGFESLKIIGIKKCQDTRCECCNSLLLSKEYTFKNGNKTFTLKTSISYISFNVIYVLICSGCLEEYIGETGKDKTRLRDRVRVYKQHTKQPEHQQLKLEVETDRSEIIISLFDFIL